MKILLGCAVAILLATLAFSQGLDWAEGSIVLPEHEGSVKAHQQLTTKVFNMLLNKQYQQAKDFVNSIPKCPTGVIKSNEIPKYCAYPSDTVPDSLIDMYWYDIFWEVIYVDLEHYQESGFVKKHVALNTVNPDLILYDAMLKHYEHLFGNLPYIAGNFNKDNKDNYVQFYNMFKNTALEYIAKSAVSYWPHESYQQKGAKEGAELYDRVAINVALGLQVLPNYISGYAFNCGSKDSDCIDYLKGVLDGAQAKADEMNDREPLDIIKNIAVRTVLNPEGCYKKIAYWQDYRPYTLQKYMSALGSEDEQEANELWEYLRVSPITEEMQIKAQGLYELCWENRNGYKPFGPGTAFLIEMKPVWCKNFKKNAHKYGFLTDETMKLYRNFEQKKFQEEMMKAFEENAVYKPAWEQESEVKLPQ